MSRVTARGGVSMGTKGGEGEAREKKGIPAPADGEEGAACPAAGEGLENRRGYLMEYSSTIRIHANADNHHPCCPQTVGLSRILPR